MVEFISNGVDIMYPMITRFGCFFLRKLRCSELNPLLCFEVLITLLEEKKLSSDLLHPSGQFRLTISQLVKSLVKYKSNT